MKALPFLLFGLCLTLRTPVLAQVDIYQSDAYSVEEMCAREATQPEATDYSSAYESCIEKNRDKPMYQAGTGGGQTHRAGQSDSNRSALENEQ